jgi:hypothetical protein
MFPGTWARLSPPCSKTRVAAFCQPNSISRFRATQDRSNYTALSNTRQHDNTVACPNDSCCQVYCWVWSSRAGAESFEGGAPPPLNWVVASFCAVHRPVKQHGKRAQKHWWTIYIKCMNHHTTTSTEPSQVQASPGPCAESGGPVCCGQPTAAGRQGLSVHCTLLLPGSMDCIV